MRLFPMRSAALLLVWATLAYWPAAAADASDAELDVLRRLDRDADGVLAPDEVPEAMQAFVTGIARRSGLDAKKPLSLQVLVQARRNLPLAPADEELKERILEPKRTAHAKLPPSPALVAETLLRLYDRDGSGVLEQEEWSRLHASWQQRDADRDGALTVAELTTALTSIAASADAEPPRDRPAAGPSPARLAPRPNLPPGAAAELPNWFEPLDVNRDGQVQMSEFSRDWTDAKLAEFMKYDTNKDGFITARECLDVVKRRK